MASWPTPNYTDPVTRGDGALIVNVVCLSLAFVVTMLRLYTRLRITCSFGLDDIFIIAALGFSIAMCAITSIATERYGWNRHIWDVPPDWLPTISKLNLAFQILFSWSSSWTKLSLLWFCKRLLGAGSKGLYWSYNLGLIAAMVFVGVCCAMFLFLSIFQCNPVRAYWEISPTYDYTCMHSGAIVFAASVINIFTDFLVTALPMPLIWNLKLPTRQRLAVISIFGLGIVVNVAGSVRTVYVWKSMIASYDTTWVGWPILLAASVEINVGLICASAPALRPLIAFFLPRLLQTSRNYNSYYNNYNNRGGNSEKLWSSAGPSKPSKAESRLYGDSVLDRMEVLRTIEMKTWTESRTQSDALERSYEISSNHGPATSVCNGESRHDGLSYGSAGSDKSSLSLTRSTHSPPFPGKPTP
ncbi:hypothetical protein FE257_005230 [Aspergillus nanangensis]|uniref:Rhodopsin domain-containing protein n=1 Tax=Aspergillus nanangensis TaxID=2582783 RepID=A0AAD4CSH3_ASPNN|nr:hypothetical protein FE257_005230 [Aspergillus nanangensis]